ncbi:MAG: endolytic transglycosylase MltG [Gemmatimonadetes bacterium]|nr:endolytic transglycosylase MltG [Gemmatimonadota bacterium]
MASRRRRAGWIVLGATLVGGAALTLAGLSVVNGGGSLPAGTEVSLRIPAGSSVHSIATRLDSAGLIEHPRLFSGYVRWKGADDALKAGEYRLTAGASFGELLRVLQAGEVVTYPLTIPEGWTIRETAGRLAEFTGRDTASVRAWLDDPARVEELGVPGPTLEGYLFPETYRFAEGIELPDIVAAMVVEYHEFWGEAERARAAELGLSERELVTLASIVEEEARVGDERPVIAGVYLNRLEIGMLLQADPTVQYALGAPKARLLYRDIDAVAANPYNTYTQPGLPPGPIASPGAASLRASLEPADHDYLFFVARIDGSHEFTRTVREHNNAKNRIRRERDALR